MFVLFLLVVSFFVKHKTVYDMRISDWSSDVCSSDLQDHEADDGFMPRQDHRQMHDIDRYQAQQRRLAQPPGAEAGDEPAVEQASDTHAAGDGREGEGKNPLRPEYVEEDLLHRRSEEHTSELQSLMRISYAVFCFKQKRKHKSP